MGGAGSAEAEKAFLVPGASFEGLKKRAGVPAVLSDGADGEGAAEGFGDDVGKEGFRGLAFELGVGLEVFVGIAEFLGVQLQGDGGWHVVIGWRGVFDLAHAVEGG